MRSPGPFYFTFLALESLKGNLACCVTWSLNLAAGLCVIRYSNLVVDRLIVVLLAVYLSVDIYAPLLMAGQIQSIYC